MLVAACHTTVITHHYQTRGGHGGRVPEEASQWFNRGNVALLPQDPCSLTNILPPTQNDLRGVVCVVFAGGSFRPSPDTLRRFPPVLVSRSRVKCVIEWLISNNEWYSKSGITFSAENLAALIEGEEDEGVLQGIEITHLRDDDTVDGSDRVDWSALTADLVTEMVAYIDGDRSERSRRSMKATVLAHVLNHKSFLVSRAGTELMNENSPAFLTAVFPHLDPWGIGGFNHPARRPDQQISFQRQLRNLLRQVDSPFAGDATFPFICWNILQKRAASQNSAFCIPSARRHSLVNDIHEAESDIRALAEKLERNPKARLNAGGERRALQLFRELNVICRSLPGSDGYKLCRRNEIRSLTRALGTPAFFLTLNPHDLTNVLVAHFRGMDTARWCELGSFEHATFVASHPAAAAKAFDVLIRGFLDIIVKYNKRVDIKSAKPARPEDELDLRLEEPPQIAVLPECDFEDAFNDFEPRDENCRMCIDGSVRAESYLDPETQSILLRRLHPWVNNYNDVVLFLLQCNMDIKFIGSGAAAKALTYYISDYITKNDLQVHVGLQAIRAAIDSHRKLFVDDIETPSSVRERNLLTKTVNAMMGRREVSHQQVMSYLIGGGDFYTSHEFCIVRFHEFVDIVIAHELHVDGDCNCTGEELTDCPENLYGSTCTAHTSDGSLSVVLEPQDYLMRPSVPPFEGMCLWQFLEQTQKVKRTSSSVNSLQEQCTACGDAAAWSGNERPAYSRRFRAPFTDHAHPQFNTHDLCI
ncbi:hypothetical protein M404DRAFT_35596 [Pisolithus tinctorius Marx 270]|uniref:Uncharacterized protein n=1 Tax=Pisolithus tinctorius Marx 270 TaxID=870435 RepID=A0A0C3NEH4_PISTI|nr:hypothetical protein M404DRAFT_35596 [Pisolithus tinctorius Marx 270]